MTAELDRGVAALRIRFASEIASGAISHLGTFNCRRKNNTTDGPWSEHAWPNAVDVMLKAGPTRKPTGDKVAAWMRSRPDLWSEVFWLIEFHLDHVHGTAHPRRNYDDQQVPLCAGGDDDMPLSDEDIAKVAQAVAEKVWFWPIPDEDDATGTRGASHALRQAWSYSKQAAASAGGSDLTAEQVADELAERLDS